MLTNIFETLLAYCLCHMRIKTAKWITASHIVRVNMGLS